MVDIRISSFEFKSTEVSFTATSDLGREYLAALYGPGACEVTVVKSMAGEFIARAKVYGLQVR